MFFSLPPVAFARGYIDSDVVLLFLPFALGVAALALWAAGRYKSCAVCLVAGGALWAALWAGEQNHIVPASGIFVAVLGIFAYLEGIKNEILDAIAEAARRGKGPKNESPAPSPEANRSDTRGD